MSLSVADLNMSFDTPTMTAGEHTLPGAPKKAALARTLSDATTSSAEVKSTKAKTKSRAKLPLLPPLPSLDDHQPKLEEPTMTQENGDYGLGSPGRLSTHRIWARQAAASKRSKPPAPVKKRKAGTAPAAPEGFEVETIEDTLTDEEEAPKTPPKKKIRPTPVERDLSVLGAPMFSSRRSTSMVAHAVPVHPEDQSFVGVGYGKLGNYCTEVPAELIFSEKFQQIIEEHAEKGQNVQLTYTCLDNKERPVPGVENTKRKLVSFLVSAARAYMEIQCLKIIKGNELRWPVTPTTVEKKKLRFYVSRVMAQRLLA